MYKPFILHSIWLILVAFLFCPGAEGQNIVANPSFEDINTCAEFSQPCSPSAWFFLSRKLTTGYFPRFRSATGHRHLQMVAASRETVNRQYWETRLLCPLEAGERYTVTMKIASPANQESLNTHIPNLRDIGLWFTPRFIFVQGDSILQPRSYLSFSGATAKDLKNGWFEIKKEFTPATAAVVLIVGNFARSANADIMDQRNISAQTIDILVDDISVSPVKGVICPNAPKMNDLLYSVATRHSDYNLDETEPLLRQHPYIDGPSDTAAKLIPPPVEGPRGVKPLPRPAVTDTIVLHNIQFGFDKYTMKNPDTLERYRRLFTRPGIKKIQVVGFTDDIGSEIYNKDLSEKRARGIASLLSSKFSLVPALITAEGRGISRTYPTKDLNRRVEIYIFHE